MSDISDFSESELDNPPTPKASAARPKAKAAPTKSAPAAAAAAAAAAESKKKSPDEEKDSKKDKKDQQQQSSSSPKKQQQQQQQHKAPPRSQRSLERAQGVLSPPDFFISKVIHDNECFTPRLGHNVLEAKGIIFIFGGENEEKITTKDLIKFEPNANSFELVETNGKSPSPRRCSSMTLWRDPDAAAAAGGGGGAAGAGAAGAGGLCLLLFGGIGEGNKVLADPFIFDLNNKSWRELGCTDTPSPRHSHAAVYWEQQNKVFIFGGQDEEGAPIKDAHVLEKGVWHKLESASEDLAPSGRCGHSACLCELDKKIFIVIFGGDISCNGKGENDLWLYDVQHDSWDIIDQYAGEPPCPRWKHAAAFFDNRLWIMGGTYAGWFKNYVMSDLYVFDFSARVWFRCDVNPTDLGFHTDVGPLTVLPANRAIYIFGGADQRGYPCADVYRLAPVCTTVSLGALSQDMCKTVKEVRTIRGDIDNSLIEVNKVNKLVEEIQEKINTTGNKLENLSTNYNTCINKLTDINTFIQQLDNNINKIKEEINIINKQTEKINLLEKKFNIMEQTLQEALTKLEKKADISSLRAVAAKVGSLSDEEEE